MKELIFTVSMEEANLILQALAELPARVSYNLITKLQLQLQPQLDNLQVTTEQR